MSKVTVNKSIFNKLLARRYRQYITDDKPAKNRYLNMLACEINCDIRTLYNFQSNTYSLKLLQNIIDALNITQEEFHSLIKIEKKKLILKALIGFIFL